MPNPLPLNASKILQRRPMGPVPVDDAHQWLAYPITRLQAQENFTRAWDRLRIPFTLIASDGRRVEPASDDLLVTVYAHQHVKLTPVLGRWCCATPPPTASVELASVYPRECSFCDRPAKARDMCWMHYSRMSRHGDPYRARPYNQSRPRHNPPRLSAKIERG